MAQMRNCLESFCQQSFCLSRQLLIAVAFVVAGFCPGRAALSDEPAPAASLKADETADDGLLLAAKAFRAAADRVGPSVVRIETFGGVATPVTKKGRGKIRGIGRPGEGPTTGLVVSPDGYIVTSTFNFLRQPPVITVVLDDGSRYVAQLLGRDDSRRICLLKIDAEDLPVPEFVPRDELRVGQWAVSVGVGYGDDEPAVSAGIVSATSRVFGRAVQTDANISPVNYGGPLVDVEGRVIGVCVPLHPQSQDASSGVEWYDSGIGFAVPLAGAERLLAALKAGKTIRPASLGVAVKPADEKSGRGAVLARVVEGSAAEKAGLKSGDKILAVNGETVLDPAHLRVLIGRHIAGDTAEITVEREQQTLQLEVEFDAGPEKPPVPRPRGASKKKPVPMP